MDLNSYKGQLVEIYEAGQEDKFYVACPILSDQENSFVKAIDAEGCFSSYIVLKNRLIGSLEGETDYLSLIDRLIAVNKQLASYDIFKLDDFNIVSLYNNPIENIMDFVLKMEAFAGRIIEIFTYETSYIGYINYIESHSLSFRPVDRYSLAEFEDIELLKEDIGLVRFRAADLYARDRLYR